MKTKNIILIVSVIIFVQLFDSCGGVPLKHFTVEKKALPADFGSDSQCILMCILKDRSSRDKYMEKQITNEYHGKYEFISESDLGSAKFKNKDIYRFLLDYKGSSTTSTYMSGGSLRTSNIPTSNYYLLDRKSNKEYNSNFKSGRFSKSIQAYAINLEIVRLKNQK